MQTLMLDTPMGQRPVNAPDGNFDRTAIRAWSWLLQKTRARSKPQKRVRDGFVLDGQIEVLSIILANSIGMASFFWTMEARRFVSEGLDQ